MTDSIVGEGVTVSSQGLDGVAPVGHQSDGIANLAIVTGGRKFSTVEEERLLALAHDSALLAQHGRAVALLGYIISACGSADGCEVNLHTAARDIGAPYSTVKSWLTGLEQAGLVRKTIHGRDGLRVELDTGRVRRVPVFELIRRRLDVTVDALRAAQVTVAHVLAHTEARIVREREVFT